MPGYSNEGEFKNVIDHGNVEKSRLHIRIVSYLEKQPYFLRRKCGTERRYEVLKLLRSAFICKSYLFGFTV